MASEWPLVGRQRERALLERALTGFANGEGGLVLVAGEAGAGKTMLVNSVLATAGAPVLSCGAHASGAAPYGLLADALRDHLRTTASEERALVADLVDTISAAAELASDDVATRVGRAFDRLAEHSPYILFLDDLQWADAATLGMLAGWARPLPGMPLLVVGAYRSDELRREHPLREVRLLLRRSPGGAERHFELGPLDRSEAEALVERVLGRRASADLLAVLLRRAHGLPFYLEELARATIELPPDGAGAALPRDVVPESVRDAVMTRMARLASEAQHVAEIAAAAGAPISVELLEELAANDRAVEEVAESGLLVELRHPGLAPQVTFRHALLAEALEAATPWTRRRRHHAALANALEARGAPPAVVAGHWIQAHQPERARPALIAAAEAACRIHAYRDAKDAIEQALRLWPVGEDEEARLRLIDRLGDCAQRCGEVATAASAWEEVAAAHRSAGNHESLALVQRHLAGVYELVNDWSRALAARLTAAEEFAKAGNPARAAGEKLAAADHLRGAGDVSAALAIVLEARRLLDGGVSSPWTSESSETLALRVRALAVEGVIRASLDEPARGLEMTDEALGLALRSDLAPVAAEVYYLRSIALEHTTQYTAALDAMSDALMICRRRGFDDEAHVCMACLTPALRHTGQWDRALQLGREVLASDDAPEVARMVAAGETGLILANRGQIAAARRQLAASAAFARAHEIFGLEIETTWGLARVDELEGNLQRVTERLRELVVRCLAREELHYSVAALRWASSFFGRHALSHELGSCADGLARAADATGTAEALAGLAHALGEGALLEGDTRRASAQFERALELLSGAVVPAEVAETQLRAGAALAAAGDRDRAVERLVSAYHTARSLRARPLAASAVRQLQELGEDVERRLGRAASGADGSGLTPREREVLGLLATGITNREIAARLFLSPRTIDMHVRNVLEKLDCRTRTEAVRRAEELSLLAATAV